MNSTKTIRLRLKLLWGIFGVLLFASNNSYAQTKISGTVVNQQTLAPVSGATITVKKTKRFAIANETGRFSIEAAIGEVLVITAVGFEKMEVKVTSSETNIQLQQVVSQLDNIVVILYFRCRTPKDSANYFRPGPAGKSCRCCGATSVRTTWWRCIYSNPWHIFYQWF
jgi:TonB-dependent starch-binding outer membrane protein SusC